MIADPTARRESAGSDTVGAMRRALALLLLTGCGWPEGLPGSAAPGLMPGGARYPDLLVDAAPPLGGTRDAAVIVAIEDYLTLGDRPGTMAIAGAWVRYFRVGHAMGPGQVTLLRDAEATPRRISRAIEQMRRRGRNGTVWLVVIGHISSATDGEYGELWLADGDGREDRHTYSLSRALARIAYGRHAGAVAVLDGCLPNDPPRSGTATPVMPRFQLRSWSDREPYRSGEGASQVNREPAAVAVYSAGRGDRCVERLPGAQFPALAYLLLGGLRGWADGDGSGNVGSVELLAYTSALLRAGGSGQPRLYGVDLPLARQVAEVGPDPAMLRSPVAASPAAPPDAPVIAEAPEPLHWTTDPMVEYARGDFVMGCPRRGDPDCERDERPTYRVKHSRFLLDPYEVTQAEYQQCVDAGACTPLGLDRCNVWTGATFARGVALPEPLLQPDHPVVCVDWWQARGYCEALGKRLPTEAEWERAAAGSERRRFPWGDEEPTCARAHFDGCGEHTRAIGTHPTGANPEGVMDLAGNVSEWVHDWYDKTAYVRPFRSDPTGPSGGRVRVIRGGSYYDAPALLRAAYRYGLSPNHGFSTVGFRCAR